MKENLILTQKKKVVMTMDKTVTTVEETLETVDLFGKKQTIMTHNSKTEKAHNDRELFGRAA